MTKKTRLIILFICVATFLVVTPNLVLYSMGYRLDLKTIKITATGGIYVRTFPTADYISIDSGAAQKPGLFSNSIFVQNLLPADHSVLVQKNGYFSYTKTIPVQKNQVTKLENILLIKQDLAYNKISADVDYFSVAPNKQALITATLKEKNISFNYFSSPEDKQPKFFSIARAGSVFDIKWSEDSRFALLEIRSSNNIFYYLFDNTAPLQPNLSQTQPQKQTVLPLSFLDKTTQQIYFNPRNSEEIFYIKNATLFSKISENPDPIINEAAGYNFSGSSIIWLSTNGLLYKSDFSGKLSEQLTEKSISVKAGQLFKVSIIGSKIFAHTDNSLLLLDSSSKIFESLPLPAGSYEIMPSSDYKNLVFKNGNEIYLYSSINDAYEKIFSGDPLSSCQWLNNNYIIFTSGDKIIISEIDYRGSINTVTLPQTIMFQPDIEVGVVKPKTFFNSQDGKVYFLTNKTLISSEKILP